MMVLPRKNAHDIRLGMTDSGPLDVAIDRLRKSILRWLVLPGSAKRSFCFPS